MGPTLSSREEQMLELAAGGFTDQAIAHKLGISIPTIGTYWGRVRTKMGQYSRTELVAIHVKERTGRAVDELRQLNRTLVAKVNDLEGHEDTAAFQALLDWSPDAIIIVSPDGVIRMANALAAEMFGYSPEELRQTRVGHLIPEHLHEAHRHHREAYMSHPDRRPMGDHHGLPAVFKGGREFRISATLNTVAYKGEVFVVCAMRRIVPESTELAQAQ